MQSGRLLDMNAFWTGHDPGPLQVLCLLSAVARGHRVRLFGYRRFDNVPQAIEQVDAREILPEAAIVRHRRTGSPALFSDRFRYQLVRRGLGAWMDADMLFLKPIPTVDCNLFGWQDARKTHIAIGILAYDPASELAEELCQWSMQDEMIPPWLPVAERTWLTVRQACGARPDIGRLKWATLGPAMFTWLAARHGLAADASPWQRFYPIPYRSMTVPFSGSADADAFLTPETQAVHLWFQGLKGGTDGRNGNQTLEFHFEPGSLAWRVAREVGLRSDISWRA
jgi:hypothetical protein